MSGADSGPPAPLRHALSVDVEDYYQVLNFQARLPRSEWPSMPARVRENTHRLLDVLAHRGVSGTFFILGLVAESEPGLVRDIAAAGHEVASHGWSHAPITALTPASFRDEVERTRSLLSSLSGQRVVGYRAPSFSVVPATLWALDALIDAGYAYDSSMFPVRHPDYGMPDIELGPHRFTAPSGRSLVEFPMTVATVGSRRIPVSGGGYFRLLPYAVTRWGFRRVEAAQRRGVFYLHPWEVDPDQPDLRDRTTRFGAFRHYTNLRRTVPRLERLLSDFSFTTCRDVLSSLGLLVDAAQPSVQRG